MLEGKLRPGEKPVEASARLLVAGLGSNAAAAWNWSAFPFGDVEKAVDLTATLNAIVDAAERVNRGDLGDAEAVLTAQTVTLNAVFVNLTYRAKQSQQMDHFERYLRLALRAQAQCRATCETLAVMRNPPVFAKQANVVNGQQQVNVNNGPVLESRARVREVGSEPSKLLPVEAHGERLDVRTTVNPSAGDTTLATVGALNGTAHGRGQSPVIEERLPRRGA